MVDLIEFKKEFKQYYSPKLQWPQLITVPRMKYVMVDGQGSPANPEFQHAVQALYGVVYRIKFARRRSQRAPDFTIAPLEGLWWTDARGRTFDVNHKESWHWTLMLWVPHAISPLEFADAVQQLRSAKPNPKFNAIRMAALDENKVAQIMYLGPYGQEEAAIKRLRKFVREEGYRLRGKHHEIYLSDPRRVSPERLATILRHPVTAILGG